MRIDILTLFPAMFGPLQESMMKRAQNKGLAEIQITNIRDYTTDKHQITDDRLYGGGAGMVMKPEPIFAAVEDCMQKKGKTRVIITSPRGELFTQQKARELREAEQLIFICGHYEGIDQSCLLYTSNPVPRIKLHKDQRNGVIQNENSKHI